MKKNISPEEDIKYGKKTIIFNIVCVVLVIATALIQRTFGWGDAFFLALFLGNIWWANKLMDKDREKIRKKTGK